MDAQQARRLAAELTEKLKVIEAGITYTKEPYPAEYHPENAIPAYKMMIAERDAANLMADGLMGFALDADLRKGLPEMNVGEATTPLSEREQQVYDLLKQQNGNPLSGKEICQKLDISQSVLTSHIIPNLERLRNVKSRPNVGYYIPPESE
jgi:biotin operon repressor